MKNFFTTKVILFSLLYIFFIQFANGQCTYQVQLSDGYENQNVNPYIIPGTTVHNSPQTFAAHTGSSALYLNFINCVSGTGTCAGAKVYEQPIAVCAGMPVKVSAWLTTSFSGTQCNMQMVVSDANGTVLNSQPSLLAPYFPVWVQYQSGAITPVTDTIYFTMYTNVGGGNGNDLSMDDLLIEKCSGGYNSTASAPVCNNEPVVSLYGFLNAMNDSTGTWNGPGALTGGYLGNFNPASGTTGTYVYQNYPYGNLPGCPQALDSVNVTIATAPVVNLGSDTTLCSISSTLLSAGSGSGYTYLWNNGVTGPNVLAFSPGSVADTITYSVVVTSPDGCVSSDSITIIFDICFGWQETPETASLSIFPNPSNGMAYVNIESASGRYNQFELYDAKGSLVNKGTIETGTSGLSLELRHKGLYYLRLTGINTIATGEIMNH